MNTSSKIIKSISAPPNPYLNAAVPCYFPRLDIQSIEKNKPISHELDIKQSKELQAFLRTNSDEVPFLLHALWALVLRCYTAQEDVCFAYHEIFDSEQVLGLPFVRLVLDEAESLAQMVKQARHNYFSTLESGIPHPPVEGLYNTILSIAASSESFSQIPNYEKVSSLNHVILLKILMTPSLTSALTCTSRTVP
jgi:hypothetical protein